MTFERIRNPYKRANTNWNQVLSDFTESGLRCVKLDTTGYAGGAQVLWSVNSALERSSYKDTLECHMYNGDVLLMYSADVDQSKVHRGRHK